MPAKKSTTAKPKTTRQRGAQPGNHNALKHGFYSGNFTPAELTDLEVSLGKGLGDEIALLRVLIRRFAQGVDAVREMELDVAANHLSTISASMSRLGALLRTDKLLSGSDDGAVMRAISAAIGEFTEELKDYG